MTMDVRLYSQDGEAPPCFLWSLASEIGVPHSQMPRLETPRQHQVLAVQRTYQSAFDQVPSSSPAGFSSQIPVEVHLALFSYLS